MHQIYSRTPVLKCDFNKVATQRWHWCSSVNLLHTSEYFFVRIPLEGCFSQFNFQLGLSVTAQKMWFSVKDFFSKCQQICSLPWTCSYLIKNLKEKPHFCAVCIGELKGAFRTLQNIYDGAFLPKGFTTKSSFQPVNVFMFLRRWEC